MNEGRPAAVSRLQVGRGACYLISASAQATGLLLFFSKCCFR